MGELYDSLMEPYGGYPEGRFYYGTPFIVGDIAATLAGPWLFKKLAAGYERLGPKYARAKARHFFETETKGRYFYSKERATAFRQRIGHRTKALFRMETRAGSRRAASVASLGKFVKGYALVSLVGILAHQAYDLYDAFTLPGINRSSLARDQHLMEDELMLDTRAAFTQRQRAIQAIHDSVSSARAILGEEARYLHR